MMVVIDKDGDFTYSHEAGTFGISATALVVEYTPTMAITSVYYESELQVLDSDMDFMKCLQ